MRSVRQPSRLAAGLLCGVLVAGVSHAESRDIAPNDWLNKMARAVQTTNYAGTVIRIKNGSAEALKVVHVVVDGVVRERVVTQEGNGLEIIRNGNEVQCILPDKKSVLVGEWDDTSTLFATLPSSEIRFGNEYEVWIDGEERIAGRKAVRLAIQPHDDYRFGHRIWLDMNTGFPLQTKLLGVDGAAIEEVKFADITLEQEIHASALQPSYDTAGFRWINEPRRNVVTPVETNWASDDLPDGFRVVSTHEEQVPGSENLLTHIYLSDGLAKVSVFIEPDSSGDAPGLSSEGASNSFSITAGGSRVTAVGDVPSATVEQIARSMQLR